MLYTNSQLAIVSGSAHTVLAERICKHIGESLGDVNISRFPDGEIFVQYLNNIRRKDLFIIQPTCAPPNETLMELLIMVDAAKRASASRITAVLPYYGYARQDRKDRPRVPITAKLVANLLTVAGVDRVITMDLHAQQIQGYFDIPLDHLYCSPVLIPYLQDILGQDSVVVAPDSGSVKMAQAYSDMLNAGLAVVSKRRIDAVAVESSHLVGDVEGKSCVITDDLTSTAGTLIAAANLLMKKGAKEVFAAVSHCLLSKEGEKRLEASCIKELITTDAVPIPELSSCHKIKVLSVANLLGDAIQCIHKGESVSSLFDVKLMKI